MKKFARNNVEILIILSLFGIFGLLKLAYANEMAFLNLYFIPVLLAGYFLGRKPAVLSAVASVLLAVLFVINWPDELLGASRGLYDGLNILIWACLLVLSSIIVSTFNESRHHRQAAVTLRLLEKYIKDKADQDNHAGRVGRLAKELALELRLPTPMVRSVETAGLLHDIADTEDGLDLIVKCHETPGGRSNPIIGEAIPILSRLHRRSGQTVTTVGPNILKIADLYDTAVGDNPALDLLRVSQYLESQTDETCTVIIKALTRYLNKQVA